MRERRPRFLRVGGELRELTMGRHARVLPFALLLGSAALLVPIALAAFPPRGGQGRPASHGNGSSVSPHAVRSSGPVCASRPAGSRWVPNGGTYSRSAEYGREQGEWFQGTKGVAFGGGRAYLFDTGRGRVTVLDDVLQPLHSFGRTGRGPGEVAPDAHLPFLPRYWTQRFIGTDGTRVALYDRAELQLYGTDGRLIWQRRWPDDSDMVSYGVRSVTPLEDGPVLVLVDSVDFAGPKPRRLQMWSVVNEEQAPELLAEREIPIPATDRTLARQARPFMANSGSCVVTSDGAERYLHVVNIRTGAADSLRLPDYEVPGLDLS